jgi:hypothetical protein
MLYFLRSLCEGTLSGSTFVQTSSHYTSRASSILLVMLYPARDVEYDDKQHVMLGIGAPRPMHETINLDL